MVGIYPEYYMNVKDNSTNPGASLIMYNYTGNNNQKFKFDGAMKVIKFMH